MPARSEESADLIVSALAVNQLIHLSGLAQHAGRAEDAMRFRGLANSSPEGHAFRTAQHRRPSPVAMKPRRNVMDIFEVIFSRRSTRGYLRKPVARATMEKILLAAARAPSGTNIQPWHVYVVSGYAKEVLTAAVKETRRREPEREQSRPPAGEYEYNPEPLFDPYVSRRRKLGWDLYNLHGVVRGDRAGSWEVAGRNFEFFGAPVGMILTMDRDLQAGSFLDCGIFLQTLMLAARGCGLDTCPQASWRHYHDVVRKHLAIPDNELVICGLSLGYADPDAIPNKLRSEREPLEVFCTFHGDGLISESEEFCHAAS
jgi:nitroreductase